MAFIIATALALLFVSVVHCFSHGAPIRHHPEICSESMEAKHDGPAQNSTAPYELIVAGCYKAGQPVKVTVKATSGFYTGMIMLARSGTNKTTAYGTFTTDKPCEFKTLDCYKQAKSAISQSAKNKYSREVFWWTAPEEFNDDVHFQATVVKDYSNFWVDVVSSDITYSETCPKETSGAESLRLHAVVMVAVALVATSLHLQ